MDDVQRKVLKIEEFVNEKLKSDLAEYEKKLNSKNAELAEFIQLKAMINTLKNTDADKTGFKTKVDLGNDFYVQAQVEDSSTILLNVGLGHFVEFSLSEALVIIDVRIKLYELQTTNLRKQIASTNATIKYSLLTIGALQGI